jgi:NAD(P)H dehydrogenase (quinone)
MHALLVLSHPRRDSFSGALADAFLEGAGEGGHTVDFLDLHRSDFQTAFQSEDLGQFGGLPMPAEVQAMQRRVDAAEALAFVYPIYWWTFPALLRGWFDRVFSLGWAYRMSDHADKALLRDRPTFVFACAGAREETIEDFGYGPAMRRLIDEGHFAYCGLKSLAMHTVFDTHDNARNREAALQAARRAGRTLSLAVEPLA